PAFPHSQSPHPSHFLSMPYSHQPTHHTLSPLSSNHHQDLHSFPTRRSSDLYGKIIDSDTFSNVAATIAENFKIEYQTHGKSLLRSEEHTSELQSRFDLVCRLLLEKKKQIL